MKVIAVLAASIWCLAPALLDAQATPKEVATLSSAAEPRSFVMARNGRVAAAVCEDHQLRVWSMPEGTPLSTINLGQREIYGMAISPDGRTIVAGDFAGEYSVWHTASGIEQTHLKLGFYPSALAFSPDSSRLALAPVGEPIQIYDVASGRKTLELQQRPVGGTAAIAFSRDGSRLAAADADTVVRIYDARSGNLLASNTEFLLEPLTAAFGADGRTLHTGGGDKWLATIDTGTGKTTAKSGKVDDPVSAIDVSPDGAWIAALLMHADNLLLPAPVIVSEASTGRRVTQWLPKDRALWSGWTEDGRLLLATADKGAVHIWQVR